MLVYRIVSIVTPTEDTRALVRECNMNLDVQGYTTEEKAMEELNMVPLKVRDHLQVMPFEWDVE